MKRVWINKDAEAKKAGVYQGDEILTAPDGCYLIYWKDDCKRKYACKNMSVLSFFGTQFWINLNSKKQYEVIDKIILLQEGT